MGPSQDPARGGTGGSPSSTRERAAAPAWQRTVRDRLLAMRARLAAQATAAAAPGATHDRIRAAAPWLAPRIEALERENARLIDDLGRVADSAERTEGERLRWLVRALLARATRYQHRASTLLYAAMDLESADRPDDDRPADGPADDSG